MFKIKNVRSTRDLCCLPDIQWDIIPKVEFRSIVERTGVHETPIAHWTGPLVRTRSKWMALENAFPLKKVTLNNLPTIRIHILPKLCSPNCIPQTAIFINVHVFLSSLQPSSFFYIWPLETSRLLRLNGLYTGYIPTMPNTWQ